MPAIPFTLASVSAYVAGLVAPLVLLIALGPVWARWRAGRHRSTGKVLSWQERVTLRYQPISTHAWLFARMKLRLDPMFEELPRLLDSCPKAARVIDVGCGYGVPGCAMLELGAAKHVWGIEPNARRARVAGQAFSKQGQVGVALAPQIDVDLPDRADLVTVIDMLHYLSDAQASATLRCLCQRLTPEGCVVIRAAVPRAAAVTWSWRIGAIDRWLHRAHLHLRTAEALKALVEANGLRVDTLADSGANAELVWVVAGQANPIATPIPPRQSTPPPPDGPG